MLRRLYNKVRGTCHPFFKAICLSTAVKVMNDTVGPNGSVLSLLLSGELSRIPYTPQSHLSSTQRQRATEAARHEFESKISKNQIRSAIRHKLPSATSYCFSVGQPVYTYQEKENAGRTTPHSGRQQMTKPFLRTLVSEQELGNSTYPRLNLLTILLYTTWSPRHSKLLHLDLLPPLPYHNCSKIAHLISLQKLYIQKIREVICSTRLTEKKSMH